MPSRSAAQHRFMEAAAHDPDLARKLNVPQKVAREYVEADKHDKDYRKRDHVAVSRKADEPPKSYVNRWSLPK